MDSRRAFTLIELLIVIAIIAILAAIAVPNFLEAQTRAKVSRTHADLRTIATAMESYRTDHNGYPDNTSAMIQITTPVAYLTTSTFRDPFSVDSGNLLLAVYGYMNFTAPPADTALPLLVPDAGDAAALRALEWVYAGRGPDRLLNSQATPTDSLFTEMPRFFSQFLDGNGVYDPTNGTISYGDVARSRAGIVIAGIAP